MPSSSFLNFVISIKISLSGFTLENLLKLILLNLDYFVCNNKLLKYFKDLLIIFIYYLKLLNNK